MKNKEYKFTKNLYVPVVSLLIFIMITFVCFQYSLIWLAVGLSAQALVFLYESAKSKIYRAVINDGNVSFYCARLLFPFSKKKYVMRVDEVDEYQRPKGIFGRYYLIFKDEKIEVISSNETREFFDDMKVSDGS